MSLSNRTCFQVNLRDCLACRVCGRLPVARENYHRGFGYHHVQFQSQGGSDEPDNIILLCQECHDRLHHDGVPLPHFEAIELQPIAVFSCAGCGHQLRGDDVEMNCGWYRCDQCHHKIHLFDHCGYQPDGPPE